MIWSDLWSAVNTFFSMLMSCFKDVENDIYWNSVYWYENVYKFPVFECKEVWFLHRYQDSLLWMHSGFLWLTQPVLFFYLRFNIVCIHPCLNSHQIASMKVHCKMELQSTKGSLQALIFLGLCQTAPCFSMSRYDCAKCFVVIQCISIILVIWLLSSLGYIKIIIWGNWTKGGVISVLGCLPMGYGCGFLQFNVGQNIF